MNLTNENGKYAPVNFLIQNVPNYKIKVYIEIIDAIMLINSRGVNILRQIQHNVISTRTGLTENNLYVT